MTLDCTFHKNFSQSNTLIVISAEGSAVYLPSVWREAEPGIDISNTYQLRSVSYFFMVFNLSLSKCCFFSIYNSNLAFFYILVADCKFLTSVFFVLVINKHVFIKLLRSVYQNYNYRSSMAIGKSFIGHQILLHHTYQLTWLLQIIITQISANHWL
jgi:hypothetical protein